MDFLLLGPLEAYHGDTRIDLGRRRVERCLLGLLLLDAGRVVPVGRLAALLWDDDPPEHARSSMQVHISRIRSLLDPHRDGRHGFRLAARGDGYVADTDPLTVDAHRFRSLVEKADEESLPELRTRVLRQALALWRGPLLADVATDRLRGHIGAGLDELRLAAMETCLEAHLACGQHQQVIPELTGLLAAHPLRERLVAALMLALYRDGRRTAALDTYRQARHRLAEHLGLDPGDSLRRLYRSILRDDPALDRYATGPARVGSAGRPAQLPAAPEPFTGRAEPLRELDGLLARDGAAPIVVICALAGTAGVGTTALAVHWAHRVRDRFPDGQLYVDLRGFPPASALRPVDALAGLLRALDVPAGEVPGDEDEAAALYRSLLAERRMLVLLDNAATADQVRPLLPGPATLVVVTSRNHLGGLVALDGAHDVALDVLTPAEAGTLLGAVLGPDRAAAEPEAAADLARLCHHLPLALRIAAAHLRGLPRRTIADYAAGLRIGHQRPNDAEAAVAAVADLSYAALPPAERRLLRLLSLAPDGAVAADAAAALAGTPVDRTLAQLDRLVAAHLVDRHPAGRYALHDLVRAWAADRPAGRERGRRAAPG